MKLTEKQKNCKYCHYPWKKIIVDRWWNNVNNTSTFGYEE